MSWIDTLRQDFRYALRMLRRSPAFTGAAVLSLALGIGATTTMFSVIYAVVLEPFPYKDPDTLLSVVGRGAERGRGIGSYYPIDDFVEITERSTSLFSGVIASTITDVSMIGTGEPERLRGNYITANTFDVMGVPPLIGRASTADDVRPGAAPVAILGFTFWQTRFGGSRDVLGQQLRLNGTVRTVIGVMPHRFMWRGADVYLPIPFQRGQIVDGVRAVHLMGRLGDGVTRAQAAAALAPILNDIGRQRTEPIGPFRVELPSFKESFASSLREPLLLLLGAVGLLLLIACSNVSNLLLARASAREREIAVRSSMGASRGRLIRQLLTESVVLAAVGAVLGVGLAYAGLRAVLLLVPPDYVPAESDIVINQQVLLFTLAISACSAIVFGLIPALQTARRDVVNPMRESGRSLTGGVKQARMRSGLVIVEVALSVVLLVGAGLMIRTLMNKMQVNLGYDASRILSLRVPLDLQRYDTLESRTRFFTDLIERVRVLPGVSDVAVSTTRPPYAGRGSQLAVPGQSVDTSRGTAVNEASPDYFRLVNAQILSGRTFTTQEVSAKRRVGVVNEAFVAQYHPNGDPIGRLVHLRYLTEPPINGKDDTVEIIGVMKDVPNRDVTRATFPEIAVPYTLSGDRLFVLVKTALPPMQIERSVRGQVYAIDKDQPVTEVGALDRLIDQFSYAVPRFNLVLFTMFAGLGLLLATIGVYGVISYSVSRQTQEFGVRVALGAQKSDIIRMVLLSGLRLVAIGIVLGCLGAIAAGRLLATQIWGVSPYDPLSFVIVIILLLAVGFQACFWPARRAARVDPMVALRQQ